MADADKIYIIIEVLGKYIPFGYMSVVNLFGNCLSTTKPIVSLIYRNDTLTWTLDHCLGKYIHMYMFLISGSIRNPSFYRDLYRSVQVVYTLMSFELQVMCQYPYRKKSQLPQPVLKYYLKSSVNPENVMSFRINGRRCTLNFRRKASPLEQQLEEYLHASC